jgi:hypothetical protein
MGLLDSFASDGTVEMKYKEFYTLMKEAAKAEIMMNAVKCNVPHEYIRESMTGKQEEHMEIATGELVTADEYEITLSAARSLFAEFDEAGAAVAADSLRRLIEAAEKERMDAIILENDRRLKEKEEPEPQEEPEKQSGEEPKGERGK